MTSVPWGKRYDLRVGLANSVPHGMVDHDKWHTHAHAHAHTTSVIQQMSHTVSHCGITICKSVHLHIEVIEKTCNEDNLVNLYFIQLCSECIWPWTFLVYIYFHPEPTEQTLADIGRFLHSRYRLELADLCLNYGLPLTVWSWVKLSKLWSHFFIY